MRIMLDNSKPHLTAVWSRDIDAARLAGRPRIIEAIRKSMSKSHQVIHARLYSLVELRTVSAVVSAARTALRSLLAGCLPSFQCLLFCDRGSLQSILQQLQTCPPDTLYCDGVRTFFLLAGLKKLRSQMRIVVDLDDLMSRRMQLLGSSKTALSLGYQHERIPVWLSKTIANSFVSGLVARYEQAALEHVESTIGHWVDAVVLLSDVEGRILEERYRRHGCKAKVWVIPPPMDVVASPKSYEAFTNYFFLGTDALPQNRLTINLILDIWRSIRPSAEIHIYGNMVGSWPAVPGVIFRGYAPSVEHIYADGTVLFAPGRLRGGIKTKVIEAFAHGCAVVGNDISFEGLGLDNYPLLFQSDQEMNSIVRSPLTYLPHMKNAALLGQQHVKTHFSREHFEAEWCKVLG